MNTQFFINNGMAWRLEGATGRACMAAIETGRAILGPVGLRDYWGNYVPSRYEVEPGTKGSLDYANEEREIVGLSALSEADFDAGFGDDIDPDYPSDTDDEFELREYGGEA